MAVIRDIALIILTLEGVAFALIFLALLAVINYGLFRFRWWHAIPYYFSIAWEYLTIGLQFVERVCAAIVTPIYALARIQATLTGMAEGLSQIGKSPD
jgi:hypothetical protein